MCPVFPPTCCLPCPLPPPPLPSFQHRTSLVLQGTTLAAPLVPDQRITECPPSMMCVVRGGGGGGVRVASLLPSLLLRPTRQVKKKERKVARLVWVCGPRCSLVNRSACEGKMSLPTRGPSCHSGPTNAAKKKGSSSSQKPTSPSPPPPLPSLCPAPRRPSHSRVPSRPGWNPPTQQFPKERWGEEGVGSRLGKKKVAGGGMCRRV